MPTGAVSGPYAWGWSALAVDSAPRGWRCPLCGALARRDTGRHHYPFAVACTPCARAAYETATAGLEVVPSHPVANRDGRRKAPPHGTRDRYYYGDGCRCEACREANARYQRDRYAQLKADAQPSGVVDVVDADGNVIGVQEPLFD